MKECFECGATEDLQEHHVVPRSRGGTKTATLCHTCHMKAHGRDAKGMHHGRLTKQGLAKAKTNGVKLGTNNPKVKEAARQGRLNKTTALLERVEPHILEAREAGCSTIISYCRYLNARGILTSRGKEWKTGSMDRLLKRVLKKILEEK